MKLLKSYFAIQKQIFEYFGHEEEWHVFPLSDETCMYWKIDGTSIFWSNLPITDDAIKDGRNVYQGGVLKVMRKEDYTMISVDTGSDSNDFLMVFDNAKECK